MVLDTDDNKNSAPPPELLYSGHSITDGEEEHNIWSSDDEIPDMMTKKVTPKSHWLNNRDSILSGELRQFAWPNLEKENIDLEKFKQYEKKINKQLKYKFQYRGNSQDNSHDFSRPNLKKETLDLEQFK